MQTLELVVARCHEDLNWLRRVPKRFRVTVYNKGLDVPALPRRHGVEVHALPNVGREAHTYLHHLIRRYDSPADITVFAQGKPFDHVPDFHKILHRLAFRKFAITDFCWLGFIIDQDDADGTRLFQQWPKNPQKHPLPLRAFWGSLWNAAPPEAVTFYPSAHFAVTAPCVQRQSLDYYRNARDIAAHLPDAAHCFERVWDRVFHVNGIPPEHQNGPFPIYLRRIRRMSAGGYA